MKMKRLAAFLITMAVCITAFPCCTGAAEENTFDKQYELLQAVGVIQFDKECLDADMKGISLGNYLVMIENLLGGSYTQYSDEVIEIASKQGILDGVAKEALKFVSYNDAVKIAEAAYAYGNDMSGIEKTSFLMPRNLTKGIANNSASNITAQNAITLVFNLATMDGAYTITSISGEQKRLKYNKESTLLAKHRSIYRIKGIVTENIYTSLYGESGLKGNDIKIDGVLFHSNANRSELIGKCVTAYVFTPAADEDGTIVYTEEQTVKNKSLSIAAEDVIGWNKDNTRIDYYESGRRRNKTLDRAAAFLYNDVICTEFNNDVLTPKSGQIDLIDNNNDGRYDVVKITANEYLPVYSVSATQNVIVSQYSYDGAVNRLELPIDDDEKYVEITKNGKQIKLGDIKEWDILTVRRSLGTVPTLTRIEVYSEKLECSADAVMLKDHKVVLEKTEYSFTEELVQAIEKNDKMARAPETAKLRRFIPTIPRMTELAILQKSEEAPAHLIPKSSCVYLKDPVSGAHLNWKIRLFLTM